MGVKGRGVGVRGQQCDTHCSHVSIKKEKKEKGEED